MESQTPAASPRFEVDARGVGWIVFDDPERTLNVLGEDVMRRLARAVESVREAAGNGRVRAVVFCSGKPDSFIAGADLDAIAAVDDPTDAERKIRMGQAIFAEVERLPVPTIAAIHGVCVGGGTELALACRHRVLSDSPRTRVGLPEVLLGILPAWGGTTRLPRLVGVRNALDLLLTGTPVDARKASRLGFADDVLPAGAFRALAGDFALRAAAGQLPRRPRRPLSARLLDGTPPSRRITLAAARRRVLAQTGGNYPAPLRILDILGRHASADPMRSLDAEAVAAAELLVGTVSKNLIHVFRMRETARKGTGTPGEAEPSRAPASLAVVGAGVMGGGIAHLAAAHGIRARMRDIRHEAVSGGLRHAASLFDKAVARKKLTRREAAQRMELVSGGLDWAGFRAADLVVEAVVEKEDVKRSVLQEAERHLRPDCVLATNTSSLSVDVLARGLERPHRFCGLHFFNPVHRMPLVEVVRGAATEPATVSAAYAAALALGKVPVVVGDGPGFLVNRILAPYLNEAGWLLSDGASVEEVDAAAREFGMPMGPLRLVDEVGVDVASHAGTVMRGALGDRLEPAPALVALGRSGRLGRKGGLGFYRYVREREKGVDRGLGEVLSGELVYRRGGVPAEDVRRRLLVQMINEAARALSEGVVRSAASLDLAMIMGTGFPPFRGGLLRFADTLHPRGVLDRTLALRDRLGPRFEPAPLLEELARDNFTFYEAFPG